MWRKVFLIRCLELSFFVSWIWITRTLNYNFEHQNWIWGRNHYLNAKKYLLWSSETNNNNQIRIVLKLFYLCFVFRLIFLISMKINWPIEIYFQWCLMWHNCFPNILKERAKKMKRISGTMLFYFHVAMNHVLFVTYG